MILTTRDSKLWIKIVIIIIIIIIIIIAAAASEPEANERGSSLISRGLLFGACNHFFLPNARNCGYAQMDAQSYARGIVVMRERKYFRMK